MNLSQQRTLSALLPLLALAAVACQTELDLESRLYACDSSADCVAGLSCLPRSVDDPRTVCRAPDAHGCEPAACLDGQVCAGTECVCAADRGECDGNPANGCEADLRVAPNCGRCGLACDEGSCSAGHCVCGNQQCAPGISCCDGTCVDVMAEPAHCGGCGIACEGVCIDGACHCALGLPDFCPAGCANLARDRNQCGDCTIDCTALEHTLEQSCAAGLCTFDCDPGYGDCDGDRASGCETALVTLEHCGACDNDCAAAPYVFTAECLAGACRVLICEPGAHNCDNLSDNGCELDSTCRLTDGLVALYTFAEGGGAVVADVAGGAAPTDLTIEDPTGESVEWLSEHNGVRIVAPARLSNATPTGLAALPAGSGLTVEAWVTPASETQVGPAPIVSYALSSEERNFTLAQDGASIVVRLRTSDAAVDANGMLLDPGGGGPIEPIQHSFAWPTHAPTHLIATYALADGVLRLYVDGVEAAATPLGGDFSNWQDTDALVVANALIDDRGWLGELYLIALYDRALTPDEVARHHQFGFRMGPPE